MASSRESEVNNATSYRKVAQLHVAIKNSFDVEYVERILQKDGDINYQIINSNNASKISEDCSVLHLAYRLVNFELFELLLNHGANFTVKDNDGNTVVHKIIQTQFSMPERSFNELEDKFTDSVLCAHVKFGNHSNPRCKHDVSHFHVACMRNSAEAVEFFLKNGVDVNQAVAVDSPIFAGYTPLHFAVEFSCLQVLEILLKYGANLRQKNAAEKSPVAVLIERKIVRKVWEKKDVEEKMLESLAKHDINVNESPDDFGLANLHVASIMEDTSVVKSILEKTTDLSIINRPVQMNSPICPGFTPLHFAAISSADTVKLLLEKGADIEAKDTNNKTPFDFCLQRFSVEDIGKIISSQTRWKNVTMSDNKTKLLDVVSAMMDLDKLIDFLAKFKSNVDLTVPANSPLWPGYTILHLAVIFSEKIRDKPNYFGYTSDTKKVVECLIRGADIAKTDANNSTALHLAFYLQKFRTVEVIVERHLTFENPFDNNNLSHFHIACAAREESAVERFLLNGVDVNVPIGSTIEWHVLVRSHLDCKPRYVYLTPGSTALHINVACGNVDITRMLIEHDADVYAKDVHGFTAIHRLLTSSITQLGEGVENYLFLCTGDLRDSQTEYGLSHLHVACHLDSYSGVKRLLDSGADINAVVTYDRPEKSINKDDYFLDPYGNPKGPLSFLSRYKGFTPLHSAIHAYCTSIEELLLERGADILAGGFDNSAPIRKVFSNDHGYDEIVSSILMKNSSLMNRLKDRFGLTMLHVACYLNNFELVNGLLVQGEDVNARVDRECPIWPGNNPLHVAVMNISNFVDERNYTGMVKLLIENGADVTLKNEDGDTPLHLISNLYDGPLMQCECAQLMLKSLKGFDVDEAHSQKMSFFHFACLLKSVSVIEGYLKNGIDSNKSVDFFADRYPGCSPLHLAATCGDYDSQSRIVNLLLEHGVDGCAKDAFDNTVLHSSARFGFSCQELVDIFIRGAVDVNAENILGETALELLIKSGFALWVEVECLLKNGSHINSFNSISQVGYIAEAFKDTRDDDDDFEKRVLRRDLQNDIIRNLTRSEYVSEADGEGRTVIHNLVSISKANVRDCVGLIRKLVEHGYDINRRDKKGRTALHTATWFRNNSGVLGLMKNGADVNVTDKQGKTAFTYSFEPQRDRHSYENHSDPNHVINTFAMHVHKMERCGLYISEVNRRLQVDALEMYYLKESVLKQFDENIKKSKGINVGSTGLTLYEFGFKINSEMVYPSMSLSNRLEIDELFKNIHQHDLHELDYLLKIKYDSAVERLRLINSAVNPFITLIKNQLPDLCCRIVLGYLSTSDLKNVIALEDL